MFARVFTLMTAVILLCAAAFAGTASDIDNCCFVDRQCHSDQEWTDGYHAFQNNQCGASSQSQPGTSAPPSAQIDNCCYVDRQCSSDQDWINGWQAYQNNQCAAPPQSGTPTSSQSAGGVILRTASGVVIGNSNGRSILPTTAPNAQHGVIRSNCCHGQNTWQCNSDQDWAEGYRAYQTNGHCSLPGLISIVGDPNFVTYYEQRLDLLRDRLPHRYNYVLNYLDKIEQDRIGVNSHVSSDPRIYYVKWGGAPVPNDGWDKRESAVLVHEACHIHRHDAGFRSRICDNEFVAREEVICMGIELEVLNELDAPPHIIEWLRGVIALTRAGENTYYQC